MYEITDYTKKQAKSLGVLVQPSKKTGKKIDVIKDRKIVASIGDVQYGDFPTYMREKGKDYAMSRRELYKKRHEEDRHKEGTPSYYADKLLW
jgi:hypothetical protein